MIPASEATDGQQGLQQLSQHTPSLILLDLMMPVMDGFDFLIGKYANDAWRDIPVVVVIAKELSEEEDLLLSGRVEQVFHKDLNSLHDLADIVKAVVHRQGRELG